MIKNKNNNKKETELASLDARQILHSLKALDSLELVWLVKIYFPSL